jgi:hypothetical protein
MGGTLTITLLRRIGVGEVVHTMDAGLIGDSVRWLARHEGNR